MKAIEIRRWTRTEYDALTAAGIFAPGERAELIDGEILQVTPQGSAHAAVTGLLHDALETVFGPGFSVRTQMPLALSPDSEPEPDLAVVRGNHRDFRHEHPATALLVIEVSDTSLDYDRLIKAGLNARAGIPDYWIVNLVDECVVVLREPDQGTYHCIQKHHAGESIAPLALPEASIPVAGIIMAD